MGKYTYLMKNVGLLTLSSFTTKLLSFFLVPLYTSVLSTGEYGTYDLFNTTISLLVPLLTFDIQEAVLRFSIDKDADHGTIWRVGCRYTVISCLIVVFGVLFNSVTGIFSVLQEYAVEFLLLYALTAFSSVLLFFVRGIGKIADLSIAAILSCTVMIGCNIFFLLVLKIGLYGYFWASILGSAVQCLYLLIKSNILKEFRQSKKDPLLQKKMVGYSKPMVANAISWWINNASDRYVVTWFCGMAANGIYSVSYKIPSIMSMLQSVFGQAWTLSATKEFDPEDEDGFFVNIYNVYNFLLMFSCSFLIFADKLIAKILFAKDFYAAWQYAPFLMISTVFSGMAAFLGGVLSAMKKSGLFAKSSVITAVVNTILNIVLVSFIGPLGAAFSTAVAYVLMWLIRLRQVRKYIVLRINYKRDAMAYLILTVQAVLLLIRAGENYIDLYQIFFAAVILALYAKEVKEMGKKLALKAKNPIDEK